MWSQEGQERGGHRRGGRGVVTGGGGRGVVTGGAGRGVCHRRGGGGGRGHRRGGGGGRVYFVNV